MSCVFPVCRILDQRAPSADASAFDEQEYRERGHARSPTGDLFSAVVDLLANLLSTDRERRWHPLLGAAYVLLAVVAVALVGLYITR